MTTHKRGDWFISLFMIPTRAINIEI